MSKDKDHPKGFTCSNCGKENPFGVYVAAHWNETLTHTCECGQRSQVRRGVVKPIKSKDPKQ